MVSLIGVQYIHQHGGVLCDLADAAMGSFCDNLAPDETIVFMYDGAP